MFSELSTDGVICFQHSDDRLLQILEACPGEVLYQSDKELELASLIELGQIIQLSKIYHFWMKISVHFPESVLQNGQSPTHEGIGKLCEDKSSSYSHPGKAVKLNIMTAPIVEISPLNEMGWLSSRLQLEFGTLWNACVA